MEERLLKLLDTEQLSSSKFADVIGVQRSSVSHILTGRNKPSFDFLQKTLQAFPMLNADWLILGEGEMYEGERGPGGGNLFDLPGPVPTQRNRGTAASGTGEVSRPASSGSHEGAISDRNEAGTQLSHSGGDTSEANAGQSHHGESSPGAVPGHDPNNSRAGGDDPIPGIDAGSGIQARESQPGESMHASAYAKKVRRVILFYDDNSFEAYDQA